MHFEIRELYETDGEWVRQFLQEHWGPRWSSLAVACTTPTVCRVFWPSVMGGQVPGPGVEDAHEAALPTEGPGPWRAGTGPL